MRERSSLDGVRAPTPVGWLAAAAALSLLASACCVLPLVLVALGVSVAWLVPMRSVTSYWPLLIVGAIVALVIARRRIACEHAMCDSVGTASHTFVFWGTVAWTGVVLLAPLIAPLFY